MFHTKFSRPREKQGWILLSLLLLQNLIFSSNLHAEEEIARIDQVRAQIVDTESLLDQSESDREKSSLQKRLDRLRMELDLLEKKEALEKREADLSQTMLSKPENALMEVIRSIDRSVEHLETQHKAIESELAMLQTMRDSTILKRMQVKGTDDESLRLATELDEQIFSIREGITALNMESEAISHEMRIATEIKRIRALMDAEQEMIRIRFHVILQKRHALEHDDEQIEISKALLINLDDSYNVTSSKLELGRQKLSQIDDEIELLNSQIGIFKSNPEIVRQRNIARSQKKFLGEEIQYLERQVAAIERSRLAVSRLETLAEKEMAWLQTSYENAKQEYMRLWLLPLTLIFSFILIYLILSRIVFPRINAKENLMILRRFSRYIVIVASVTVVIAVLFEDMQGFFTVLGIISAGLVIALQDVCTAIAGWVTILTGGKFLIGDRIEVDGSIGDVIDIDLLRTTIIEINAGLDHEHPTGRMIVLPNSFVLRSKVANASHGHPYKWVKEVITFTFESNYQACKELMERVIEEETRENFEQAKRASSKIELMYGIKDAEYRPKIYTKIADSGYQFDCLHVCYIKRVGATRSKIHNRLALELLGREDTILAYPTTREIHSLDDSGREVPMP